MTRIPIGLGNQFGINLPKCSYEPEVISGVVTLTRVSRRTLERWKVHKQPPDGVSHPVGEGGSRYRMKIGEFDHEDSAIVCAGVVLLDGLG